MLFFRYPVTILPFAAVSAAGRPDSWRALGATSMAGDLPPPVVPSSDLESLDVHRAVSRNVAHEIAQQLVAALDRLAAVRVALSPGGAAASSLEMAQQAVSRAGALAGRLASLGTRPADGSDDWAADGKDSIPRSGSLQILVVDDDEFVRTSVAAVLLSRELRVLAAADGPEALDLFLTQADAIDAVVLDMDLPAMNGASILRELRSIRPDVKVVISSGGALESLDPHLDGCNRLAFAHKS